MTNSQVLFWQSLGETAGYCVAGINSRNGMAGTTDVILAGTTGLGSWRGVQAYNASVYPGGYYFMSENAYSVVNMAKFVDIDGNAKVLVAERDSDTTGYLKVYTGVNPPYYSGIDANPTLTIPLSGAPESICIDNFSSSGRVSAIAISSYGQVDFASSLDSSSSGLVHDYAYPQTYDVRYLNHMVTSVHALDGIRSYKDVVTAHLHNVTAITSNNWSVHWEVQFSTDLVENVATYPNLGGNNRDGVIVATNHGVYLLNSSNGKTIANFTGLGSDFRCAIPFADYNNDGKPEIITGNSAGVIFILDVNPASPTFNQVLRRVTFNREVPIWSILDIEDVNGDGKDEFAIGSTGLIGVLYGNNATWRWVDGVNGYWWNASDIYNVYSMALLDDRNGDGHPDIAVAGYAYSNGYGGLFIYSAAGTGKVFQPSLHGEGGFVLPNCTANTSQVFTYSIDVYQDENLPCTASVSIDGSPGYAMILGPQWGQDTTMLSEGVTFTYTTTLAKGIHTYSFNVTDTNGDSLPFTTHNGPDVGGNCNSTTPPTPSLDPTTIIIIGGSIGGVAVVASACGIIKYRRVH